MLKTFVGPVEDSASMTYLRPETAQGMFVNFKNVLETSRKKIPFGIAQIGKSFRNEITPGNFLYRMREFEIAEIEYFVKPDEDEKWFDYWLSEWQKLFLDLGIKKSHLQLYEHSKKELAHYSKRTVDLIYNFPFGKQELAGVANRTDYDLKQHQEFSGKDFGYFDETSGKKYLPYVIEPTLGIERVILAIMLSAFEIIKGGRTKTTEATKEEEIVLHLHTDLAPIKIAVLPLVKKLSKKAQEVYKIVKKEFVAEYDEEGSIGRRYRRQDEIGTPYCLTIDFETLRDKKVTIRDRDTMEQERVKISGLIDSISKKLAP
jgi:glycyl-tRNA synthetase